MKIHFLSRDPRAKTDPDFEETCGSFDVITNILRKRLRAFGMYAEDIDEATHVGIADSLATDFNCSGKKCFGIFFIDTIDTIPSVQLYRALNNPNLKVLAVNQHNTDIFTKYGVKCTTIGPALDFDYWKPTTPKNDIFTFFHPGFSNNRSGLDLLLDAYCKAFSGDSSVQLIIKNTSDSARLESNILERSKYANIKYVNRRMRFEEMRDLYSSSHVTCSVLRMSGHGLCIGEAAACGSLPLVGDFAPSNSLVNDGCAALLKPSSSIDIRTTLSRSHELGLTDTFGGLEFVESPLVWDYSIDEYASTLKDIRDNWDAKYKHLPIRDTAKSIWDTEASCSRLIDALDEL